MATVKEKTYWNGEPAECRKVRVRVGKAVRPSWWCAKLEGTVRNAVEAISWDGKPFYLDDEDARYHDAPGVWPASEGDSSNLHKAGVGWWKVTVGEGDPDLYHAELPVAEVLGERE